MKSDKVTVIGAGNGGQAIAGHLAMKGFKITLYSRCLHKIENIIETRGICIKGEVNGFGLLNHITDNLEEAVKRSNVIMVVTTADAHRELASKMAPYLCDSQIIVLNPGRTGGAFEFRKVLVDNKCTKRIYIVEAQSLVYACRQEKPGTVQIIGIKNKVLYSCLPAIDIKIVEDAMKQLYQSFIPVDNVLITSLENIGAIFHPSIVLFNAAAIERGEEFYFYNDMTPHICNFLEKIDSERIAIGQAYGLRLRSAEEWIMFAYEGIQGHDLLSKIKSNPAYYNILAPKVIYSRFLTEDIPTGILPMLELGKIAGLRLPLMESILNISQQLLDVNFLINGRTLENLGLTSCSVNDILKML